MNTRLLLRTLANAFPKRLAEGYDHVGQMIGKGKLPVETKKVLLCLDFDFDVLPIAEKVKPDLIITHHPFIFGTPAKTLKRDPRKAELYAIMEKLGIPIYSFHTNFDTGVGGMNDALAEAMGLKKVYTPKNSPAMRIGYLPEEDDLVPVCKEIKRQFGVGYGALVACGKKRIQKIGIIAGAGSREWVVAMQEGCDLYISCEAPHHVRRDMVDARFNYLDFPHEIEHIFMPTMQKILLKLDPKLEITCIDHEIPPQVI